MRSSSRAICALRLVVIRTIPIARADLREPPQKRHLRLAGGHGIVGKPVTEIRERELEPLGQRLRAGDRLRQIPKEPRHSLRRLQEPLGIHRQQPPRLLQRRLVTDAREDVVDRPRFRRREPHAVGRHHRQPERGGEIDQRLQHGLLVAPEMPLQFHPHLAAAERAKRAA